MHLWDFVGGGGCCCWFGPIGVRQSARLGGGRRWWSDGDGDGDGDGRALILLQRGCASPREIFRRPSLLAEVVEEAPRVGDDGPLDPGGALLPVRERPGGVEGLRQEAAEALGKFGAKAAPAAGPAAPEEDAEATAGGGSHRSYFDDI